MLLLKKSYDCVSSTYNEKIIQKILFNFDTLIKNQKASLGMGEVVLGALMQKCRVPLQSPCYFCFVRIVCCLPVLLLTLAPRFAEW